MTATLEEALKSKVPDIAQPIVDGSGNFAMIYYRPGKVVTRCGSHDYVFLTQANICLTWVKKEHTQCILGKKGGCCGQKRPGVFSFANASTVRRWVNKGGR